MGAPDWPAWRGAAPGAGWGEQGARWCPGRPRTGWLSAAAWPVAALLVHSWLSLEQRRSDLRACEKGLQGLLKMRTAGSHLDGERVSGSAGLRRAMCVRQRRGRACSVRSAGLENGLTSGGAEEHM